MNIASFYLIATAPNSVLAGELSSGLDRAELTTRHWDSAELPPNHDIAELPDCTPFHPLAVSISPALSRSSSSQRPFGTLRGEVLQAQKAGFKMWDPEADGPQFFINCSEAFALLATGDVAAVLPAG
ncbi:hypothetical protein MMC29_002578 [Sticta canariensis]|nr:hypothetical protein [Sticta canariensis]